MDLAGDAGRLLRLPGRVRWTGVRRRPERAAHQLRAPRRAARPGRCSGLRPAHSPGRSPPREARSGGS